MEFHETKEKTQKQIAEMLLKENYSLKKTDNTKFTDTFDLFRIMKINENLSKKIREEEITTEKIIEKEFTDKKSIDFIFARREEKNFFAQKISYSKLEISEIKGTERDLLVKFDKTKQDYLKNEQKNQLSFTNAIINIGNNYDMKLY